MTAPRGIADAELDPVTGRPTGTAPAREHRIVGPPGTGKTYRLTSYAERGAQLYGADGVAIASLTKAAAKEIARRAEGIEGVGTLHAHAFRGLDRPGLADIPEGLRDWNLHVADHAPTLRLRVGGGLDDGLDFADGALGSTATEGEELLADLNARRARMEDPAGWPTRLARFADLWSGWKARTSRVDFTDLIVRALDELPCCPGDPAVLLLDEAQDLSALEFELARRWGAAPGVREFVVCGDPDQNLYAWRGADPDAFWRGDAATDEVLDRSRRVPAAVQAYALDWVRRIPGRRDVSYLPRREDPDDDSTPVVQGEVRALPTRVTYAQPDPLLVELRRDLDAGRTVMVLASCSYMLEPLARLARDRGIPYHNPYRPKNGAWNPLRGAQRIRSFLRPAPAPDGEGRVWSWEDVRLWMEPMRARGALSHGAKALVEYYSAPERFADDDVEAPLSKVLDLMADDDARDRVVALDLDWWERALLASHARRYAYPCTVARRHGARALRQRPRLILGTIHSVKGGEADSVYLFPDLSRAAALAGRHQPSSPTPASVRLFYVAMTRARERLTLLEPAAADYVALPRPGGGSVHRRGGKRLAQLAKQTLDQGGSTP